MNASNKTGGDQYGIGAVAKLTGLTDHTIRAWERRYGAIVARRAANGRRVYDREQVEKLGLLRSLTEQGVSIGHIASDDIPALRERASKLDLLVSSPVPERINVAVLGEFLPAQLDASRRDLAPMHMSVTDNNRDRFAADLNRHDIDVVIFESPVLDLTVVDDLKATMKRAGASGGVLVYNFGRTPDVNQALDAQVVVLRAPVSAAEVRAAALRAVRAETNASDKRSGESAPEATEWDYSGPVAPRRFTTQQLASLVQVSTTIDCECPHHLAQLVGDLNAFEVYSANCENRDDEDAALHRYLHETTAQARALIEVALERVARAESIKY